MSVSVISERIGDLQLRIDYLKTQTPLIDMHIQEVTGSITELKIEESRIQKQLATVQH